jgi:hypothetical protein
VGRRILWTPGGESKAGWRPQARAGSPPTPCRGSGFGSNA